eukprot:GHVH01001161.1.p1 GENE.GHVH01001161.1~~GHVH01001161.1.p1  ORF type:complete len:200 (-),score=14.85 GHVH01001161.1:84-683(-)
MMRFLSLAALALADVWTEEYVFGLESFSLSDIPAKYSSLPSGQSNLCVTPKTKLTDFAGSWKLSRSKSQNLDSILKLLGHRERNIDYMRNFSPVSVFRVDEVNKKVSQRTSLPMRRSAEGDWLIDQPAVPRISDRNNGIVWTNVLSGFEDGVLFSKRGSDNNGTMYDVRHICTDANGDDWMLFIFTLNNTRAYRWLKKM